MPLDYRILLGAQPPQPFSSLGNMQQLGQMADEDRARQQERQAQQVIQEVLSKNADNPDAVPAELLRRGFAKQSMAFDEHLSKRRKAILDQRNSELDLQVKAGTIEKNKADLEKAAHVDPKAVLPYLANQADQEGYDEGIALAKLAHGKNADAILATLPKIWSPEVSKRLAGMLMTPDQVADNASKAAGGGGSDYATYLARHAAGLNKKPSELTSAEELDARAAFYRAQSTGGGGSSDFGSFLNDYLQGEAEKAGKTVDTLGAATKAALTLKARQAFGRADDAAQRAPVPIVIQTGSGPQLVDRGSATSRPITDAQGNTVVLPPTADQRNRAAGMNTGKAVIDSIDELSAKINTQSGVIARISGAAEKAKAEANMSDDVGEYEALVSGFTPLLARAVGHTGVLTEQDVRSVKKMLPQVGDSKSIRDRKMARIRKIMSQMPGGAVSGIGGADTGEGASAQHQDGEIKTWPSGMKAVWRNGAWHEIK